MTRAPEITWLLVSTRPLALMTIPVPSDDVPSEYWMAASMSTTPGSTLPATYVCLSVVPPLAALACGPGTAPEEMVDEGESRRLFRPTAVPAPSPAASTATRLYTRTRPRLRRCGGAGGGRGPFPPGTPDPP